MPERDYEAMKRVIADYTAKQLLRPPEELRAEIEASQKEIRDNWLGISDFMMQLED